MKIAQLSDFAKKQKGNSWRNTEKVVIYTRVSTREQALNNTSLETQRKSCEKYALNKGFTVIKNFGGTYGSAKTDERKEFKELLAYVKIEKGISAIIVYSYDRFSRSENAGYITGGLEKIGVKVLSVIQQMDVTSPSGKLHRSILFAFGNYDNEQRKQKSMAGMIENLRNGYWVAAPPLGYTNLYRKEKANKHKYIINEEGKYVKLGFELKAEGKLNNVEIVDRLRKLGSKIEYKSFPRILTTTFYAGKITHAMIPGEIIEGKHPAIISEDLFLRANSIDNTIGLKGIPKQAKKDELPLKIFLRDEISNSHFTGYKSKGIFYYKTVENGTKVNVRAEKVNKLFANELKCFEFRKENNEVFKETLTEVLMEKLQIRFQEKSNLEKQRTVLINQIGKLEERYVLEDIDKSLYLKYRNKFELEIAKIEEELSQTQISSSNFEKAVEKGMKLAQNLSQTWLEADFMDKRKLQELVFPEGVVYNKQENRVRTFRVNTLFSSIAELERVSEGNKKSHLLKSGLSSHLVAGTGIEPVFAP